MWKIYGFHGVTVYMVIFAVVLFPEFRESVLAKISTSMYGY